MITLSRRFDFSCGSSIEQLANVYVVYSHVSQSKHLVDDITVHPYTVRISLWNGGLLLIGFSCQTEKIAFEDWLGKKRPAHDQNKALEAQPIETEEAECLECFGTGHFKGFGGPCSKGCAPS